MKNKAEVKAELAEISPFLAKMKDQNEGFKVPEGYFAKQQSEILSKLAMTAEAPTTFATLPKKGSMLQATWFKLAMAASVVGLVAFATFYLYLGQAKSSNELADLSQDEISNYISVNLDDFEEDMLIKNSAALFEAPTNFIKTEDIDRYLKESIDDLDIDEIESL